jgi:hypothetical protein
MIDCFCVTPAASAALGEGCAITDPLANVITVARTCPLPPLPSTFPLRLEEGELVRLGAGDYPILNVMMRSLIAANRDDPAPSPTPADERPGLGQRVRPSVERRRRPESRSADRFGASSPNQFTVSPNVG